MDGHRHGLGIGQHGVSALATPRGDYPMTGRPRRYSDTEVALILRQAAQLDAGGAASGASEGLSLADIQRIAGEVGIAPEVVARAATVLAGEAPGVAARIFGGPTSFAAEHEARGEVPRRHYGDVVEAIRRVMGTPGRMSEVLDGMEWRSVGETTQVTVAIRPASGRTRVQIFADRGGSALLAYLAPGVAAIIGGAITGAILNPDLGPGFLIIGTAASAGFLGARTIWAAATRRFRRTFAALVDAVTAQVDRHGADPAAQISETLPER